MTLTYKVTRQGYDISLYSIDFPEMNNLRNKKIECSSVYTCQIITPFHFFQNLKNYDVIQGHGVTSAE